MTIYYYSDNPNGFVTGKRFSIDKPCVTVMAAGMGGDSYGHWHFADDGKRKTMKHDEHKPPYRVPSMDEVRAIPWNGLTVASTFSGAGGSCTGYRMAGYRVLWANEFVPRYKNESGLVLYMQASSVEEGKELWAAWQESHRR